MKQAPSTHTSTPNRLSYQAKKAFAVGSLFLTLLGTGTHELHAQTTKKATTSVNTTQSDAITFAVNNVDKYYPDMKQHLNNMLNSFRDKEQKDTTIALLNKMTKNIKDPEQKVGAVIYALEMSVFYGGTFITKHDKKINDDTFTNIDKFDDAYKAWFKKFYAKLEANIETLKASVKTKKEKIKSKEKELIQGCQQIEKIMDKFSPEDIQKNESIKKLVTQTKELFISSEYTFSSHTKSLFDIIK